MLRVYLPLLVSLVVACGGPPEASLTAARTTVFAEPSRSSNTVNDHRSMDSCAYLRTPGSGKGTARAVTFDADHCPKPSHSFYPWLTDTSLSKELLAHVHDREDILVVRYKDCTVRYLGSCGLRGAYRFTPNNRTEITEFILSKRELARKLPFDARELTAHFRGAGTLSIKATRVGTYATPITSVGLSQLADHCRSGTHFVKKMDMGAFRLRVKTQKEDQTKADILKSGGVLERCLLSTTAVTSTACQSVLKLQLVPILQGGPVPDSDPHPLLGQLPGAARGRRLETDHMGQSFVLPVPGKITAIAFWNPAHGTSLEALAKLGEIWQRTDRLKTQIVAVATNTTIISARKKTTSPPIAFPLLIDDRGRLGRRFKVDKPHPSVLILDEEGIVQFYADESPGYLRKVEEALAALTNK